MAVATRSKNKQQKSDNLATEPVQGQKRKATTNTTSSRPSKKAKETKPGTKVKHEDEHAANSDQKQSVTDDNDESITINRAPVLELWASCVTQTIYHSLPWSTCLSVGGAISTITAISKGRAIGAMEKPDPGEAQAKRERRREQQAELDEVEVMGFHLRLKDGSAMIGDKPKKGNEETLRKKYGDEDFERAKKVFQDSLAAWKGKEDELSDRAFKMYEDFRPTVPAGQKGWGRKGQLRLATVKDAVARE